MAHVVQSDSARSKPSSDTDRRVSCVYEAESLTSVKTTAHGMNFKEAWKAVLRLLVFSEFLSLVVFCLNFDPHRKHVYNQNSAKAPTLAPAATLGPGQAWKHRARLARCSYHLHPFAHFGDGCCT